MDSAVSENNSNAHGEPMTLGQEVLRGATEVEKEHEECNLYKDFEELMAALRLCLNSAPKRQRIATFPIPNMWAFLIAIENYPKVENVPNDVDTTIDNSASRAEDDLPQEPVGALKDAQAVYDYLVIERGVPESHIMVLRDAQATRANIIDTFQAHLTHNEHIGWGDPILFYLAGHGGHGDAPAGWPGALEGEDAQEKSQVEYIIPHDSIALEYEGQPGIPDRTTRALIRILALRKGRNISVVLDCCSSGNGVRKGSAIGRNPWRPRGVKAQYLGKLRADTDSEIWKVAEAHLATITSGSSSFKEHLRDEGTHIVLAACTRLQSAHGSPGSPCSEGRAQTYTETLAHIKAKLGEVYKLLDAFYALYPKEFPSEERLEKQNPQCEGLHRDRLLFGNTESERRCKFTVEPGADDTECVILGAGVSYGLKQGTMFELRYSHGEKITVLGSVVAQDVGAESCVARLPQDFILPDHHVQAVISKLSEPVTFDTRKRYPESTKAIKAFELLNNKLATSSPYYNRVASEKAELVLEVDDEFVHFKRQDIRLSTIDTPSPKLPVCDIERIADVMKGVAHFNYYLSFESDTHPFSTQVEVRMHELERANVTYGLDGLAFADQCQNMKAGQPVPFEDGEALIQNKHDEQLYALVLRSSASQPLFVHVLLFDPATYGVDVFSQPLNADDPALKPNQAVQFGRSPECEDALWFDVAEDNKKDTGYLKIILATEGHLDLSFMAQAPILGDDCGNAFFDDARTMDSAGNAARPMKGVWDVITRKLTILPSN